MPGRAVGVLLTVASCIANPPVPPAPAKPDPVAADVCRPPYVAPASGQ